MSLQYDVILGEIRATDKFAGDILSWTTNTLFKNDQEVIEGGKIYTCLNSHTSGVFSTDLTAGKWVEVSRQLTPSEVKTQYESNLNTNAYTDSEKEEVANIQTHISNVVNPHNVTALQSGADPSGSADAVQANLSIHEADIANPHGVTASQAGAEPSFTKNTAFNKNFATITEAQEGIDNSKVISPKTAKDFLEANETPEISIIEAQNTATISESYVSGRRFWQGITKFISLAWTWAEKQTFSKSIGVGAAPSSSLTGGMASPAFKVTQLITNHAGLPVPVPPATQITFTTSGGTILMFVSGTGWKTGNIPISIDIKINSNTVYTMNMQTSLPSTVHITLPSAYIVKTGLAAGTQDISFTLTSGNVDGNDRWNVTIMELPF